MSPQILDGYIIAVDTADVERSGLLGKIVVACHRKKGLLVSRLVRLRHRQVLVSDHRKYKAVPFSDRSQWRIIGKVL